MSAIGALRARRIEESSTKRIGVLLYRSASSPLLLRLSTREQPGSRWLPDSWGPSPTRRIARLNMIGSIFFMISAVAAYVIPDTDEFVNASLANLGTLVGALYFFWAAWLLLRTQPVDET